MFHQAYVSIFNFLTDISTTDADAAIAGVVKRGFCNCAGKTGWGFFFICTIHMYIFPLTLFCLWIIFAFPCCHVFVSEFIENLQTSNNWLQPEIIKSAIGTCAQLRARWQQYNNMLREGESEVRESTAAQLRGNAKWNSVCTLYISSKFLTTNTFVHTYVSMCACSSAYIA